jgi:hypothetical protein
MRSSAVMGAWLSTSWFTTRGERNCYAKRIVRDSLCAFRHARSMYSSSWSDMLDPYVLFRLPQTLGARLREGDEIRKSECLL